MTEAIKIALVNYITDNIEPAEKQQIEAWIEEDDLHKALYLELQETWNAALFIENNDQIHAEQEYRKLLYRLKIPEKKSLKMKPMLLYAAAVLFAVFITGIIGYLYNKPAREDRPLYAQSIYVPVGNKKKLILKDSTVVWLNSGSVLQVSNGFGVSNRTVYLEGEGYFEVKTNKKLVFTVKTKEYTIRDIGTIFNIKTYSTDAKFEAAVMEGEISIEGKFTREQKTSKIFLKRNGVLKIDKPILNQEKTVATSFVIDSSVVKVLKAENIDNYAGWKDNLLVFDDDNFTDIAHKLERKYNVTILIKDEQLANYRYSGSFNNIPDIQNILDILKETTPVSYSMKGDTITISSKK
jgi:ferric-dicitrate binding protein FerR (iron transport regulator)